MLAVSAVAPIASAQISGAIYDTNFDGTQVNLNQYDHCYDVYLNGGPQNQNAQGLPPGEYYYQVTNPSGNVLLSADDVRNRRLRVTLDPNGDGRINGPVPDPVAPLVFPGHFNPPTGLTYPGWNPDHNTEATPNPANLSSGVHLWPFYETPNNGGVYKVWLIPVDDYEPQHANNPAENFGFKAANQKTDNFTCVHDGGPTPPSSLLSGVKFYDLNHNGVYDATDPVIPGWEIEINGTLDGQPVNYSMFTDEFGEFSAELDEGTTFKICEVIPTADPVWIQSHPTPGETNVPGGPATADADKCWTGTVGEDNILSLDFGNYREITFSGHKFYDANNNGVDDDNEDVAGIRINVYLIDPEGNESLYDPADPDQGYTTVTDANGDWSVSIDFYGLDGYTFRIEEVIPGTGDPNCVWVQTYPATGSYTVDTTNSDLDFGNVCFCYPTNGRTLGFWSNRNGQRILNNNDPAWRTLLNGYTLRNADGSDYDVPGTSFSNAYGNFRTWLLNGTAENMSYMLSVQLAASLLNTNFNNLSDTDELILPDHLADCWGDGTATLTEVYAEAEASLAADLDGQALAGDDNREYQECLKTILDMSNNNALPYVHDGQCAVVYP